MKKPYMMILALLCSAFLLKAQESFLTPATGYKSQDILSDYTNLSGFTILGDTLVGNASDSIIGISMTTNELLFNFKKPAEYTAYTTFLKADPTGKYLWSGYTSDGNTDDRIYRINIQTGVWEHMATLPGNMDIDFSGDHILISGLNSADWTAPNAVFLMDQSGNDEHRKIIDVGGSATGFAVTPDGAVCIATSSFTSPNALYKWEAGKIANMLTQSDASPLTTEDATLLSGVPAGAYDCETDSDGTPVFTFNTYQGDKVIAVWNGMPGDGYNLDTIAYTDGEWDWLTYIHCEGSISTRDEGRIYTFSWGQPVAMLYADYSPFIQKVHAYVPAPGQHINHTAGSPSAAETIVGGMNGNLSLGAFGGYVVFSFDGPVENDPANPFGVDFTIFGNAMPGWAEHGIVSVMQDENENGFPDDTWYELAGSDYFFSATRKQYEVTYENPGGNEAKDVPWTDNLEQSGSVLAGGYYNQSLYPMHDSFPNINPENYTLSGTCLPDPVDRNNAAQYTSAVKPFGYADSNPKGSQPYTLPDNPYSTELENSGGDAFDISWAVDAEGNYADLASIDFVKVHTGVLANAAWLGEVSTEIRGAVDVKPADTTGIEDLIVIADVPDTIRGSSYQLETLYFQKGRAWPEETILWDSNLDGATVSDDHLLTFNASGNLTLEAYLAYDPHIKSTLSVVLEHTTGIESKSDVQDLQLYPNPAHDYVHVPGDGTLKIYNLSGILLRNEHLIDDNNKVYIGNLAHGLYLLTLTKDDLIRTAKLRVIDHNRK